MILLTLAAAGCPSSPDGCPLGSYQCPGTDQCAATPGQCPYQPSPRDFARPDLAQPDMGPTQGTFTVSRSAIDFGSVLVGTRSSGESLVIRNDSGSAVRVGAIRFEGPD